MQQETHTIAMVATTKVGSVSDKSLDLHSNERLREILREIVDKDFRGNKTAAGKVIGISQAYVTEILAGRRGAGNKLLGKLATYTGRTLDDLSGRKPARAPARSAIPQHAVGARPQWADERARAEEVFSREFPREVFDYAEHLSLSYAGDLNLDDLYGLLRVAKDMMRHEKEQSAKTPQSAAQTTIAGKRKKH